ncbi:MAG: NAD-dependent epimerase/dehydratase family protein [Flavobacteriales bacterium]|jgi:UDP-glucose 4-epimerase|nr:NAD-dependent epimerase/dehydratase family protein [Flavobacteriales bacterium]
MKQKKNILITGVAGFIGSNLLNFLIQETDWDITGLDNLSTGNKKNIEHHTNNERFKFILSSCNELTSLKPYDLIFHLAALPRIQPSFDLIKEHIDANLTQAIHLIELMIKEQHFPRIIYSGSSAVYGTPNQIPTSEEERIDCLSPYAFQKYEFEKYLELISTRYPIDYVTLRYFNPYGDRSFNPDNKFNAYSSVVGIFLNKYNNQQPLLVTGDGKQQRDFIHVMDLARANYLASIHPNKLNTMFNVGFGSTLSILELAKLISPENILHIDKREGEAEITFADTTKIKQILGWAPQMTIQQYIKENIKKMNA